MSRGFYSTFGSGTTDKIVSAYTTGLTQFTLVMMYKRNGAGGNNNGRLMDRGGFCTWATAPLSSIDAFAVTFSGGAGDWRVDTVGDSDWHCEAIAYNGSNTANNPTWYRDGAALSVTRFTAPSGSITTTSAAWNIGNRSAGDRGWDGLLAHAGIYSGVLDAELLAELTTAPFLEPECIRPDLLVEHIPMLNENVSTRLAAPTITGTAVQDHPRTTPYFGDWEITPYRTAPTGLLRSMRRHGVVL